MFLFVSSSTTAIELEATFPLATIAPRKRYEKDTCQWHPNIANASHDALAASTTPQSFPERHFAWLEAAAMPVEDALNIQGCANLAGGRDI